MKPVFYRLNWDKSITLSRVRIGPVTGALDKTLYGGHVSNAMWLDKGPSLIEERTLSEGLIIAAPHR